MRCFDRYKGRQALDAVSAFLGELSRGDMGYEYGDKIDAMLRQCEYWDSELLQYPMSLLDANPEKLFWEPLADMLETCMGYLRK